MTEDARFEEGGEQPLRLRALDTEDLSVVSSLLQDSVFPASEMAWDRPQHRFALLVNRFRWEDAPRAESGRRDFERVRTVVTVENVLGVRTQGVPQGDADTVLSLLSLGFEPGDEGAGRLLLTLAGDGAVELDVEALEVTLRDVTRPYLAPSRRSPDHPE